MAKGRPSNAKIAKGKAASKRFNAAGEEIVAVKMLRPVEVPGKPGVFRYREVMTDVVPSKEKEIFA